MMTPREQQKLLADVRIIECDAAREPRAIVSDAAPDVARGELGIGQIKQRQERSGIETVDDEAHGSS